MRHKEHPLPEPLRPVLTPLRLSLHSIADPEEMPIALREQYSAMKYGDGASVAWWAKRLAAMLMENAELAALHKRYGKLFLAPSAYGSVPTAATTLVQAIAGLLSDKGWNVEWIQIRREGGFERTNYGALGVQARQKAMRLRKIGINPATVLQLAGGCIVVIDDIRCTGAHERAILNLLVQETAVETVAFGYCIAFGGKADVKAEEELNHTLVQRLEDLLPFFDGSLAHPHINARMLKFILLKPLVELAGFWPKIGAGHGMRLYAAALSEDGYFDKPRFREGFRGLEDWLFQNGALRQRDSYRARNLAEGKLAAWNIALGADGSFVAAETGEDLAAEVGYYSRFKFGDVGAIQAIGRKVATQMIAELEAGGSLRAVFERASERGEFMSLTAPGVRNVVSASNFLAREVGLRVNAWLAQHGLPTLVIRTLGRLSSGRDNYAELSSKQRAKREKTSQTIMPRSEYEDFPSHVVFLDDVEVSGATASRAKEGSLSAGALSFHQIFAMRVDPQLAQLDAGIEHRMNHFAIGFGLDGRLKAILQHPDYQPVQRMLRLLLNPENHTQLVEFLSTGIDDAVLLRLYLGAMANDYLWIRSKASRAKGMYGPSLESLRKLLITRGILDGNGLPY